ncbi:electron transfer flavoprotein subunit beta/FixA family protein [Pseudarthrobacter sulfonivorans]|uniref:electron transfer flavoprotein subunit beta/FixA family protein n=1 Tax=Pseudarthrobacter sulfonivorans TaxID=121292 RepID=UPI0009FB7657|nr:hypothetical protein [Pseudarthrobacter sulfonivorans]
MKNVVLMKQVPDTEDGHSLDLSTGLLERQNVELIPDEINERSLDVALSYKDSHKGTEVVVLSMGPDAAGKAIRKSLQVGADSAVHITDPALAGADALRTTPPIWYRLERTNHECIRSLRPGPNHRPG